MAWSEAAIHYFAERAIDPDLAAKLGVRENGHGLEFPYPHGMGEQFARTRSLNGAGPKVCQPSATMLVPWQPVPNRKAREVLVTEGNPTHSRRSRRFAARRWGSSATCPCWPSPALAVP